MCLWDKKIHQEYNKLWSIYYNQEIIDKMSQDYEYDLTERDI